MVQTVYNYRPDDLGLRALRRDNAAPRGTQGVTASAPPAPTHDPGAQSNPKSAEAPAPVHQRRGDRRQDERRRGGDRRKRDIPVLLDTRSNRERRQSRPENEDAEEPIRGIDVYT